LAGAVILISGLSPTLWAQSSSYPIPGSLVLQKQEQVLRTIVRQHPELLTQTTALHKTSSWGFSVGSTHAWYATDMVVDTEYSIPSTCRAVGTNCYIFVEDSSWTNGHVTQAAVDSIQHAFDLRTPANPSRGIFSVDTSAFGNPPNVDNDARIIILILNIRDGYSGSGGYVAGYFYSINEYLDAVIQSQLGTNHHSNYAEIYYVDCNPANLTTTTGFTDASSTTAHEFQHMIHFNYTDRIGISHMSFINEGCSVLAEVNCGYPIYPQSYYDGETNHYLFDWRTDDNINVLKDYSRAARYFTYLRDQVGIGVFKKIVSSQKDGAACLNDALTSYGSSQRFATLLPDWFIANILNDTTVNSLYGYRYAGLSNVATTSYSTPTNSSSNDTVERYAAQYYTITSGYNLKATFTTSSSNLFVQAVETGTGASRVVAVPPNTQFSEPSFGTTYSKINFIVYDTSGTSTAAFSFTTSGNTSPTEVATSSDVPQQYALNQNYPNPFNPTTMIQYQLPAQGFVTLKVYDVMGREVATLVNQKMNAGIHSAPFDGSRISSGVYFYRITADKYTATKKLLLLK
jgi:hypothetical protein